MLAFSPPSHGSCDCIYAIIRSMRVAKGRYKTTEGGIVALARASANLTQRELGRLSGVPQATIARIEAGTVSPRFETISRILAGAGLEMRIQIAERDTHDEVLEARYNSLSEDEKRSVDYQHQNNLRMFGEAGRKGGLTKKRIS